MVLSKLEKETNRLKGDYQHGFRPYHSTTLACLEFQSYIAKGLGEGKIVAIYSIDLLAAFDLLWVDKLMELLKEKREISDRFGLPAKS